MTPLPLAVNCAARLSGQKRHGDLIVCGLTAGTAGAKFLNFIPEGTVRLKGRETPLPIFRPSLVAQAIRRVTVTPSSFSDEEHVVGRDTEIRECMEALGLPDGGKPGRVRGLICEGGRGMGKSLLGRELVRQSVSTGAVECVMVEGDPISSSTPYSAFRGVFEHILGLSEESIAEKRFDVMDFVHEFVTPALRPYAPLLDKVLHVGLKDTDATRDLKPEDAIEKLNDLLCDILFDRARRAALFVVLDDAQLLDEASWGVLEKLVKSDTEDVRLAIAVLAQPLHFVVASRHVMPAAEPEASTTDAEVAVKHVHLTGQEHLKEMVSSKRKAVSERMKHMHLTGIDQIHLAELVSTRTRVPVDKVPHDLVSTLAEKSVGTPLIALELLTSMVSSNVVEIIEKTDAEGNSLPSGLKVKDEAKMHALPSKAKVLIRSRLDALEVVDDLFVKIVAAFGMEAPLHAVEQVFEKIMRARVAETEKAGTVSKPETRSKKVSSNASEPPRPKKASSKSSVKKASPGSNLKKSSSKSSVKKPSSKSSSKTSNSKPSKSPSSSSVSSPRSKRVSGKASGNSPKTSTKAKKSSSNTSRTTPKEKSVHSNAQSMASVPRSLDSMRRLAELGVLGHFDHDTVKFHHSSMRDAVLESMVLEQRMAVHHAICQHFETHHTERPPLSSLGFHYGEVVLCQSETRVPDEPLVDKALSLLSQAIDEAKWAGAALTVVSLLEKQRAIVDAVHSSGNHSESARERMFDVLSALGMAYTGFDGPGSARGVRVFEQAMAAAYEMGDDKWDKKVPVMIGIWYSECVQLRWEFSCEIANRLIEMGTRSSNPALRILGLEFIMCCKVNQGDFKKRYPHYASDLRHLIDTFPGVAMEAFSMFPFWPTGTLDYAELQEFAFGGRVVEFHERADSLLDCGAHYGLDATEEWAQVPKPYAYAHGMSFVLEGCFIADEPERARKTVARWLAQPDAENFAWIESYEKSAAFGFFGFQALAAYRYFQICGQVPLTEGLSKEGHLDDLKHAADHGLAEALMDGSLFSQLLAAAYIFLGKHAEASELLDKPHNHEFVPTQTLSHVFRGVLAEQSADDPDRVRKAMRFYDRAIRGGEERHDLTVLRAYRASGRLAKENDMPRELAEARQKLKAHSDGLVDGYEYDEDFKTGPLARYIADLED
jgi:AAA ATPase domain